MFIPYYTITNKLLSNIKKISAIVIELNNRRFQEIVLFELEKKARELSTYASTSIEGNPLPLTDVKRIIKTRPKNLRESELEIANYNTVLEELSVKLKKNSYVFNIDFILYVHRKIVHGLVPEYQLGNIRKEPVFVNDPKTGQTVYWPPDHHDVPKLIDELLDFINKNKKMIDPLILAGLFHKQFVIIHPFMDGNGRTTRICTKSLLFRMGLDTFNLFSFENFYNKNVTRYFENVGVMGNYYDMANQIDFTGWLEYFTDGVIDELLRVREDLMQVIPEPSKELFSYHMGILEYIEKKGYITDKDYAKMTERAKATRSLDFKKLMNLGYIERKGKGRATYYVLKEK